MVVYMRRNTMPLPYPQRVSAVLDAIAAQLPRDGGPLLARFTRQFYAKAPLQDLEKLHPPEAAATAHLVEKASVRHKTDAPSSDSSHSTSP